MNRLLIVALATLAVASAAPSGLWGGWGLGHGAVLAPAVALAPAVSTGAIVEGPKTAGAIVSGPVSAGAVVAGPVAHGAVLGAPLVAPLGHGILTPGGGAISVSGHGAVVSGPPTAPVVVAGPAGAVKADGLWGPTLVGGPHVLGHAW